MAAYTFRAAGTMSTSGNPGAPAGVVVGDLLLLAASARVESETFNGPPTGWTKLYDLADEGAARLPGVLLGRIADGTAADTPSGYDAWSGSSNNRMQIAAFYGDVYTSGLGSIVANSAEYGDTSSYANLRYPGITPPQADCLVITVGFKLKTVTSDGLTSNDPAALGTRIGFGVSNGSTSWLIWSYIQQTTAAAISSGVWTQSIAESADQHCFHVALKTAAAVGAGWTANPSMTSQTATAYTIGFTPSAAATIYGVGVIAGSTAPSIAQVKAGQNAAGAAAKAANSKAVTGVDTLVLTPSDSPAFPRYDLYFVLNNGGGDSSLQSLLSEYLDPPTGKSFTTLESIDALSPYFGLGVAVGDTVVFDSVTTPDGYAVTCAVDGTISYSAFGDDSRQIIADDAYDYSAAAYLGAGEVVVNNRAPDGGGAAFTSALTYQRGVAITPIDLTDVVPDPEGDVVTAVALDALPTGLTVVSSTLSGTPTVYGTSPVEFQWDDVYGAPYNEVVTIEIGDVVPDVVEISESTARAEIQAIASFTTTVINAYSASVARGDVISTLPAAGELVAYDAVIEMTVSVGALDPSNNDAGKPVFWQRKRKKRTLKQHPNLALKKLLDDVGDNMVKKLPKKSSVLTGKKAIKLWP